MSGPAPRLQRASFRTALVVLVALVDCREPTEIRLVITTDIACREFRGVDVSVGQLGRAETSAPVATTTHCDAKGDVGTIVIVPSGARDAALAVKVVAGRGRAVDSCKALAYGPGCVVARRELNFVAHTPLSVTVALRAACDNIDCDVNSSCVEGVCRPAQIADISACATDTGCDESELPSAQGGGGTAGAGGHAGSAGIGGVGAAAGAAAAAGAGGVGGVGGLGGGAAGAGNAGSAGAGAHVSAKLVPAKGAWWGINQSTKATEPEVGRVFDVIHFSREWTDAFPSVAEAEAAGVNTRFTYYDWQAIRSGGSVLIPWSSIAAGDQNTVIDQVIASFAMFPATTFFVAFDPVYISHVGPPAPNGQGGQAGQAGQAGQGGAKAGTTDDYVAAYRYVHQRFAAQGITNVVWVWVVYSDYDTGAPFDQFEAFYPGDDVVDWVGWSAHNGSKGAQWAGFATLVSPFYDLFSKAHGDKPFMLAKYGSIENIPATQPTKADWINDVVPAVMGQFPKLRALIYDNYKSSSSSNFAFDSSDASLAAFKAAGELPYVNQPHE